MNNKLLKEILETANIAGNAYRTLYTMYNVMDKDYVAR